MRSLAKATDGSPPTSDGRRQDANGGKPPHLEVQRVRKAYEQVAEQLRHLIVTGELEHGERLPNETELARQFAVSRSTVREALRTLAAQSLVVTAKGAGGGTYITGPTFDYVSDLLHSNIALLTELHGITLEELLEARLHLEVPAARLAAQRRTPEDVERLSASIPDDVQLTTKQVFSINMGFHSVLMHASGNALLSLSALPVFTVLQTSLARSSWSTRFHKDVAHHHELIAEAVVKQDENAAAELMSDHLQFLEPHYEEIWRHARRGASD